MNPKLIATKDPATQLELSKLSTIDLLQSWIDGEDAEDQKETGDYLVKTLDEDRSSLRELFPSELATVYTQVSLESKRHRKCERIWKIQF
jgi:hypothetical protein